MKKNIIVKMILDNKYSSFYSIKSLEWLSAVKNKITNENPRQQYDDHVKINLIDENCYLILIHSIHKIYIKIIKPTEFENLMSLLKTNPDKFNDYVEMECIDVI